MTGIIRLECLIFLVMLSFALPASASNTPVLIAVQPAVTVEPFYQGGEFDINLLPVVVGVIIDEGLDVRISMLANYHAGGKRNGIEQIGMKIVVPYQFYKVSTHGNLYAGPCAGYSRWMLREIHSTTLCGEGE